VTEPGVDRSAGWVETERLRVRPLRAEDAGAVRRIRDDAAVRRWAPTLGDGPHEPDSGDLREGRALVGAVVDRDGEELVGVVRVEPGSIAVRLEVVVAAPARRRGLGTELVTGLAGWAFRQGAGRVELLVAAMNEAGLRLALAAGFRREGQLRGAAAEGRTGADAILFARVPADPAGRTPRPLPDAAELTDGVVVLRPVRPADEDALLDERADADAQRWATSGRAWTRPDVRVYIALAPAFWLAGAEARFAVVDAASGTCAGSIGLRVTVPSLGVAELGYGLRASWRGRGLATRAVRLVADWAFTEARLGRLELGAAVGNLPSQLVAERAGFRREGVARLRLTTSAGGRTDEVRFGLTPTG
jgi:RimJ/RimL family protein N-acetyltransferase